MCFCLVSLPNILEEDVTKMNVKQNHFTFALKHMEQTAPQEALGKERRSQLTNIDSYNAITGWLSLALHVLCHGGDDSYLKHL